MNAKRSKFKLRQNFRLCPVLTKQLESLSKKTGLKKTTIVEKALAAYFAVKT